MKKSIIVTMKYLIIFIISAILLFHFFPERFHLFNVICCTFGSLLGIFLVNLIEEKKKERNKKLHFWLRKLDYFGATENIVSRFPYAFLIGVFLIILARLLEYWYDPEEEVTNSNRIPSEMQRIRNKDISIIERANKDESSGRTL